ncbi:SURF1 family protein [Porticoccus sp.]|uniref:SURF1 family protein n=1 Tax=Porticoccus sp. TaxID=2024853 RepID=UPI003F699634
MSVEPQQQAKISFQWQWNWKILLFAGIFFPITLSLAFWQLERADEKHALLDTYQQKKLAAPVSIAEAMEFPDQQYVRVHLNGEYDNRSVLLVDNQVRNGRPGYEVVTPFKASQGEWLLVNRGWLPGGLDRSVLPDVDAVSGNVTLVGYLYRSPGKQLMLGEDIWKEGAGPKIIQNAAPENVSDKLSIPFYDYTLRLDAGMPGALETGWQVVNVVPGMHTGYAVQWAALSMALLILTLVANSNVGAVLKHRNLYTDKKPEKQK